MCKSQFWVTGFNKELIFIHINALSLLPASLFLYRYHPPVQSLPQAPHFYIHPLFNLSVFYLYHKAGFSQL